MLERPREAERRHPDRPPVDEREDEAAPRRMREDPRNGAVERPWREPDAVLAELRDEEPDDRHAIGASGGTDAQAGRHVGLRCVRGAGGYASPQWPTLTVVTPSWRTQVMNSFVPSAG